MLKRILVCELKYIYSYSRKTISRTAFPEKQKDEIFQKLILNSTRKSFEEWKMLRNEMLSSSKQITNKSIDYTMINFCLSHGYYEQAKLYIDYMKKENMPFNLATLGKCFQLHYILHTKGLATKEDEKNILLMYKNLCKEYSILDSITNENIILGLSVTKNWKECLKHFNDIKISCVPSGITYNAVVCALFCNNNYERAWLLFQEMIENNRYPLTSTYLTYLEQINKTDYKMKYVKLVNFLEFAACNGLEFDEAVANKILNIAEGKSKITSISNNGICKICKKSLQSLNLSTEEFDKLKKAFFDSVIVGRDIFRKSTPEELQRFLHFIKTMDKFDVVVDGLNVLYSAGAKQSPYVHSMLLAAVVRHFATQGKQVLVVGRTHMEKLPKQNWNFVKTHSTVFLTENLSQDDPYILYCGLSSGPNTILVTRDFMRSHLYLLKDKQHKLSFRRWLTRSRYHLVNASPDRVIFKTPSSYMTTVQGEENCWHIPYVTESKSSNTPLYRWLCVKI